MFVFACANPEPRLRMLDRFLVIAEKQRVPAIIVANKVELIGLDAAEALFGFYPTLGYPVIYTSVKEETGVDTLKQALQGKLSALAGPSGVGKSSLISAIEPTLDLRIGAISGYTGKGRHTTSSAKRYRLSDGSYVIDTPGVKQFGLWGVSRENLSTYFPDVEDDTAPKWRIESYERILESLPG